MARRSGSEGGRRGRGKYASIAALSLTLIGSAPPAQAHIIPIDVQDGHAYVQVRLPHVARPLWFLLDSGAATPVNLISKATADALGIKGQGAVTAGAIGGKVKLTFTPPLRLAIGGTRLAAAQLAIIPLGGGEDEAGHKVDGILGYSFFAALNLEIDYPHKRLRLSANPPPHPSAVPLHLLGKNAAIDASLVLAPGQPPVAVRLIIDTGYDLTLLLTSPFVRKHDLLKAAGPATTGAGLGGDTTRRTVTLPALAIGATNATNVETQLSTDTDGAFATDEADGYLGGLFLQNYSVLFDYRHNRFALTQKPD